MFEDIYLRFLAAPNPPGNTTAAKSLAFNSETGATLPLAILADSMRQFLSVAPSSPFTWFTSWKSGLSGAKKTVKRYLCNF